MIAETLQALSAANLAAAPAILAVLALRRPVRRRFGARAAYGLWIAPLLTAAAAALPHQGLETVVSPLIVSAGVAAQQIIPSRLGPELTTAPLLFGLWLAGALATAALLGRQQANFLRSLGRLTPVFGAPRLARAEGAGAGPAVVGALRPRIVAPADFETRYAADEQALILAHERAHVAAGDAQVNAVACLIQCLCWFNPLVHLGLRAVRIDQELACDEAVIRRFPDRRRAYAQLLLKTQLSQQALPVGCQWPPGSAHPLKERIAMLKSPLPAPARRAAGAGLVTALALAGGGLAWAAKAPQVVSQPDWISRPVPADLVDAYPADAAKAHLEGRALMRCGVAVDGGLVNCKVLSATPTGAGFGEAALKLAARFQMKPMTRDGRPAAGGIVRIPVRFRLPSPAAPAPAS